MISEETIKHIAKLARLALTPEEVTLYSKQLAGILDHVGELAKVNTEGVVPLVTPTDMAIAVREDVVVPFKGDSEDWAVENAPDKSGNLYKVPAVL